VQDFVAAYGRVGSHPVIGRCQLNVRFARKRTCLRDFIHALERELDELHRIEEVLVSDAITAGQAVHRHSDTSPQAVLGVKLVEAKKESRAA
jgi:hypothetical protein